MLRSYSPIGFWSVSKEAMGQLLGGRNRWGSQVPGDKQTCKERRGEFAMLLMEKSRPTM